MNHKNYLIFLIVAANGAYAIDNPHFYRATNMFLEPRLEHDYLTTFDATLGEETPLKGAPQITP